MTDPFWDETDRSQRIDRASEATRLPYTDPPPPWMRPQGRQPAEQAAHTLRLVALLIVLAAVATGVCIWSLP